MRSTEVGCQQGDPRPAGSRTAVASFLGIVALSISLTMMPLAPTSDGTQSIEAEQEEFSDDTVSLMQRPGSVQVATKKQQQQQQQLLTLPLQKQYVPIRRNETVIAYKTAYFGQIRAGNPEAQTFTVVFDTGSGHMILPNQGCESPSCAKHRRYIRKASKSAVDIEHTGEPLRNTGAPRDQLSISFGTGDVVGEFVRDSVCLGNESIHCTQLGIVTANSMSQEPFGLFEFDGVLGLGFGALVLNRHFSLLEQMSRQNPALVPQFSVFLARDDTGQSAISFGGYDRRWTSSELQWMPVDKQELGYWLVQVTSVRIGDQVVDECVQGECRAILDTGTSLLGVPRDISRTMHRMLARPVPGDNTSPERAETDCRGVPGKPVHFVLSGGATVTLSAEDYSRPTPFNMTLPNFKDGWELFCRSLLLPLDMKAPLGPKVFIWGEPVLRRYLTVYDWGQKRVGFAVANNAAAAGGPNSAIGAPPPGSLAAGVPLSKAGSGAASSEGTMHTI